MDANFPKHLIYAEAVHNVSSESEHRRKWQQSLRRRNVKPWLYAGVAVPLYINHGRVLIDCPFCGAGVAVPLGWAFALCRGCGCEIDSQLIARPSQNDWAQAVTLLAIRPLANRNWVPSGMNAEPVWKLAHENAKHLSGGR